MKSHENKWNSRLMDFQCHVCGYPTSDGHWHPNHTCPPGDDQYIDDWMLEGEDCEEWE
jgi:hypothetical protein